MKSLSLNQPHVIIMVGVPGSGKTFFAEKFAETFNAPYVSLEKILFETQDDMVAATAITHYMFTELLKTRQSIIIEGATNSRADRDRLTKQAKAAGYETLLVWVQTDPATAKIRSVKGVKSKANRTLSPEEHDRIVKRFTAPNNLEKPIVISGKHTYATQAKIVLKKLSAPRAEISTHDIAPVRTERSRRSNIIIR